MAAAETTTPAKHEGAPETDDTGQVLLFKGKFEGKTITDVRLNFGGNIELGDPDLIKALTLDSEVRLVVVGRVVSRGHKMKSSKDGGRNGAISSATVVVETVALDEV